MAFVTRSERFKQKEVKKRKDDHHYPIFLMGQQPKLKHSKKSSTTHVSNSISNYWRKKVPNSSGFMQTEKRFKKIKQFSPGPGSYFFNGEFDFKRDVKDIGLSSSSYNIGLSPSYNNNNRRRKKRKMKNFSVFRSNSRFREINEDKLNEKFKSPGPGSYNLVTKNKWNSLTKKKKKYSFFDNNNGNRKKKSRIVWVKEKTVPSIPTNTNGKYGNGSENKKDLERENEENGSPPSFADTTSSLNAWKTASSSFVSKTKRSILDFAQKSSLSVPGPGSYSVGDTIYDAVGENENNNNQNQTIFQRKKNNLYSKTSSFASQTKRMDWIDMNRKEIRSCPGPGNYLSFNYNTGFRRRIIPRKYQNFGNSTIRILSGNREKNKFDRLSKNNSNEPGPGDFYKDDSSFSNFTKEKKKKRHGPFLSTSKRFLKEKNKVPGPGKYGYSYSFGDKKIKEINKMTLDGSNIRMAATSVNNSFGTTSKRFNYEIEESPGAGDYDPKILNDLQSEKWKYKSSHLFLSRTERETLVPKDKKFFPGPGSYNVNNRMKRRLNQRKFKYFSNNTKQNNNNLKTNGNDLEKNIMLELDEKNDNNTHSRDLSCFSPGPGHYNLLKKGEMFGKKVFSPKKREKKKMDENKIIKWYMVDPLPGPGSYDLRDDWNKSSYNVTLS